MSENSIEVSNLSKRYIIGKQAEKGEGLRHVLERAIKSPLARLKSQENVLGANSQEFWALKDVTVDVKQGEVLGIIGRNGAGKSTMLKLLSRITQPTTGRVKLRGRVASLLEVGTGFHPELTGRENIYLNGAILGMTRVEIKRKFDEIVDFSGVEKFLDTPVKRYSSGMYVRLAFSVAAHLEPEILVVDEVLAVGDSEFQRKCLGKMEDVAATTGRTILFVSHNMTAVENLCSRAIMLQKGQLVDDGLPFDVIQAYNKRVSEVANLPLADRTDRKGKGGTVVERVEVLDASGGVIAHAQAGQDIIVRVHYRNKNGEAFEGIGRVCIDVSKPDFPYPFFHLSTELARKGKIQLGAEGYIDFKIPRLPMSESDYNISTLIETDRTLQDWVEGASNLSVVGGDFYGTGKNTHPDLEGRCLLVDYTWEGSANGKLLQGGEFVTS